MKHSFGRCSNVEMSLSQVLHSAKQNLVFLDEKKYSIRILLYFREGIKEKMFICWHVELNFFCKQQKFLIVEIFMLAAVANKLLH